MKKTYSVNIVEVLDRLKSIKHFKREGELARYLGIKPSTLSMWRKRNTIAFDTIYNKCMQDNISLDLLFESTAYKRNYTLHSTLYNILHLQNKTINRVIKTKALKH